VPFIYSLSSFDLATSYSLINLLTIDSIVLISFENSIEGLEFGIVERKFKRRTMPQEKVEEILGLDTSKYQLSVVVPFGYRLNEQSSQLREKLEDVVEFIK